MAHRTFHDSAGVEWMAYDVVPHPDDRRDHDRRRGDTVAENESIDRRGEDRRLTVQGAPVRLTQGWLCFEREEERRRLQPIPDNWHLLRDSELAELLGTARVAPKRKPIGESAVNRK